MTDQGLSTDPEWSAWWDDAWRPTPRWLTALGAARHAQSFEWPTAARQSWYRSPAETVPINAAAPPQDTYCSGQDAFTETHIFSQDASTQSAQPSHSLNQDASAQSVQPSTSTHDASTQLSWLALSRRRICSKKRPRARDHRFKANGSPAGATHAHYLSNWIGGMCVLCCVPLVLRVHLNIHPLLVCMSTSSASIPPHPLKCQASALASDAQCQYRPDGNTTLHQQRCPHGS